VIKRQRFFLALLLAGAGVCFLARAVPLAQTPHRSVFVSPAETGQFVSIGQAIRRDPFAGAPGPDVSSTLSELTVPDPNDDSEAPRETAAPHSDYALKATIVGATPVAYITAGSIVRIVRIGDTLGERRIVEIDALGLTLSDASRLTLGSTRIPSISPVPRGALRRARSMPKASSSPEARTDSVLATPMNIATVGPLPTVKPGAYPFGARPTSDPAAPTAFPYPYPYPPR